MILSHYRIAAVRVAGTRTQMTFLRRSGSRLTLPVHVAATYLLYVNIYIHDNRASEDVAVESSLRSRVRDEEGGGRTCHTFLALLAVLDPIIPALERGKHEVECCQYSLGTFLQRER